MIGYILFGGSMFLVGFYFTKKFYFKKIRKLLELSGEDFNERLDEYNLRLMSSGLDINSLDVWNSKKLGMFSISEIYEVVNGGEDKKVIYLETENYFFIQAVIHNLEFKNKKFEGKTIFFFRHHKYIRSL